MFTGIKTSKKNKELVTTLTRRLNLGAENIIARLAFSFSMANGKKMELTEIEDAQGKEYSTKILFGEYADIYIAMVCVEYELYKSSTQIPKYIKMHIDDGLQMINKEVSKNDSLSGMDFIINKIEKGLRHLD